MTVTEITSSLVKNTFLALEEIDSTASDKVGGKAFHLARLKNYGFSVPKSLVITTDVYDHFVSENNLRSEIISISKNINAENLLDTQVKEKIQ